MTVSPTISIAAFRNGSKHEQQQIAKQAAAIYLETQYLCIVDHGVDEVLTARLRRAGAEFFALPLEAKLDCLALTGLGYLPSPDSLELPVQGNPASPHEQFIAHLQAGKNPWPDIPADFRAALAEYNVLAEGICRTIVRMMAMGVDIPVDRVIEADDAPNASFIKLIAWQKPVPGSRVGEHRLAPHHDYAAVGLLKNPDRPNGLQVRRGREWVEAYSRPGELVVFLGEQLTRWTDGRVPACWHRVANDETRYDGDGTRLSSCYFYNPGPMVADVERYLAGRAKYSEACAARLRGESVEKQTWTRRFRWAST